ncbi:hypothetical protein BDD26_0672 [Xenorhabdus cabanillasii]|uniref:Uncharacterized protein n=1 Tax=Xenorhabdus cabanillasii TaxID=351673 RepID=A0A3D9U9G2_9GAMM|nr:hypothetical protein [Xenorhabdus cabanillasii]REF26089.1 hypothetical protein BDD26_0672 [Xenorhabdus cabanillasii]
MNKNNTEISDIPSIKKYISVVLLRESKENRFNEDLDWTIDKIEAELAKKKLSLSLLEKIFYVNHI